MGLNITSFLFPENDNLINKLGMDNFLNLLEVNLTALNLFGDNKEPAFDLTKLSEDNRVVVTNYIGKRPAAEQVKDWLVSEGEFYISGNGDNVVLCKTTKDNPVESYTKLKASKIQNALMETFYKRFDYYAIHNKEHVLKKGFGQISFSNVLATMF